MALQPLQPNVILLGVLAAAVMTFIYPPRLYFGVDGRPSTLEAVCEPHLDTLGDTDVVVQAYRACIDSAPLNVPLWLAYVAGIALLTLILASLTRPHVR